MDRRLRTWLLFCIVSVTFFGARAALAAPNDAAAQKLRDQAIDQDYLATNFTAAEQKLNQALNLCKKTSDCSPYMRARLHCDLGVVEYTLKKIDLARTEFATALMEDPNVTLDTNLSNTDVQREFAAVKSGGPLPATGPATGGAAAGGASQGGITHEPPARTAVRTPLPLYAEVAEDIGAARVMLQYKPVGSKEWKALEMRPMNRGFGAEIPCGDVGDRAGELEYYIQVLDGNGDLVANSGRAQSPHKVAVVKRLQGEAPHFPGQNPPLACSAARSSSASAGAEKAGPTQASDCPPGFPGCHEGPETCDTSDDCEAGAACVDHVCVQPEGERPYKKNWLSIGLQLDDLVMPGADDACAGGKGYSCFQADTGAHYDATPALGRDDKVLGGFSTSPMLRIVVGYDRAVSRHVTLGGRFGYAVVGAGPQRPGGAAFMPLHLEGRLAYWFGRNVFSRKGLRFFALLAGGVTEVDASQGIDVFASPSSTSSIPINAWTKTGLGFGAAGVGMMVAFTPNMGIILEDRGELLFPTFGFAETAQLAFTVGL